MNTPTVQRTIETSHPRCRADFPTRGQYHLVAISAKTGEGLYEWRNFRMGGREYTIVAADGTTRNGSTIGSMGRTTYRAPREGRWTWIKETDMVTIPTPEPQPEASTPTITPNPEPITQPNALGPAGIIKATESNLIRLMLTCGHYTEVHEASSVFDYPQDGDYCPECRLGRQFRPDVRIYIAEQIAAAQALSAPLLASEPVEPAKPAVRHEVEVDTAIAAHLGTLDTLGNRLSRAIDSMHIYAGDKQEPHPNNRKLMVWKRTEAEIRENPALRPGYYERMFQETLPRIDALRTELAVAQLALRKEEAKYTGWSRFFLVPGGHIHRTTACSTCYPTTTFLWLPTVSGLTEAAAVAEHGPHLCSVCFPTAPVEWTLQHRTTPEKTYCAGSGRQPTQGAADRRRYVNCPVCGKAVARTKYGDIRKHVAEAPKTKQEEAR